MSEEDVGHATVTVKYNAAAAGRAAVSTAAAAAAATAAAASIASATATINRATRKRVAVSLNSCLGKVEVEAGVAIVLIDALADASRVEGTARLPRRDPGTGGRVEGHGATAPLGTVGAENVGGHDTIRDAGPSKKLQGGAV